MVKSRLSDEEIFDVGVFVSVGNASGLVKYLNKLLYQKGLGTDCCARPIAARDKEDMKESCYAEGYIKKTIEFINDTRQRLSPTKTIEKTLEYLEKVQQEIREFFQKSRPR